MNFYSNLSPERRQILLERQIKELAEFLSPRLEIQGGESEGRSSGSLDWRLARGETKIAEKPQGVVIRPNSNEISKKKMKLSYNCAVDKYFRDEESEPIGKWSSLVYEMKNIFMKRENDWKQVYLARTEKSEFGEISWKFDFSETNFKINSVQLKISSQTFENGEIKISLCGGDFCVFYEGCESKFYEKEFFGCKELKLTVLLKGGKGNSAWQHAQLFRCAFDSVEPQMEIFITFQ